MEKNLKAHDARFAMHGRILRCPLGGNPEDCPLYEVRQMPLEDRLSWLNSLGDEEVIELFCRHKKCLGHKIEDLAPE